MIPLLDVQKAALQRSNGAIGFAYFMEQGLGKTLTAEADLLERVAEGNASRSLVVAPTSFKGGWIEEIAKYNLPINAKVWDSKDPQWTVEHWMKQPSDHVKQLVVNYEAIRSERIQEFLRKYMEGHNVFGIWDESIQVSTFNADQTVAAINIAKELTYSRILSGKPIKQGPHDLWSQMRVIKQLNGYEYYPFRGMFCKMGGFKGKQVIGAQNENYLGELIDKHVFRATKAEWTNLPPKLWTTRSYELTKEMREYYRSMEDDFVVWLKEVGDIDNAVTINVALTKFIKLAQIQGGWIFDEDRVVQQLVSDKANPRLNLLKETIANEVTGKVIIPYVHKPVFDQLMANFNHLNPAFIKGEMDSTEIEAQKRRFNNDRDCTAIFLQMKAGKYGHTLLGIQDDPAYRCSTMIFYENTYSLDDRGQIEDRFHRHGQTAENVLYIDLVGTELDRSAIGALQRKEGIFQAIVAHLSSR